MVTRETAARAGRAAAGVLMLVVVALFVVQAAPGLVGAEHSYVVLTGSMAPTISPGDTVIVDDVAPRAVSEGDVITFREEAGQPPVTHRVVEVIESDGQVRYRTKGDNNEDPDPGTVTPDQLVGRVWFTIPYVGYVTRFGNTTVGRAVLIGGPILAFLLSELWSRAGEVTVTSGTANAREDPAGGVGGDDGETAAPDDGAGDGPANGGAPAPAGADDATEGLDDGVSFGPTDLRLGAVGFGTFALYAAFVAVRDPTGLSVGVAVGAGIAAAFHAAALALLAFGASDDAPTPPAADESADGNPTDAPGGADD